MPATRPTRYPELRAGLPLTPSFPGPTLFLRGMRSDYVGAADGPVIQQMFPRARLEAIPGAGHWVHAEAFDPFMQAVTQFLNSPDNDG